MTNLYGEPGATGDFEVTFVSGEAAVGVGIEILSSLDLGVTLRIPFAWQRATIPAELGTVIVASLGADITILYFSNSPQGAVNAVSPYLQSDQ